MKRSSERILTTHVGRLQRPEELTQAMEAHPRGQPTDAAFAARLKESVAAVVRQQAAAGLDIVCDGERQGEWGRNASTTAPAGRRGAGSHQAGRSGPRFARPRRVRGVLRGAR